MPKAAQKGSLLEDYFGTPYPFEKLDMVAIPKSTWFGAMENPGMITYSQGLLLQKEVESTIAHRRGYAQIATHEMAHMWFGDLVTMLWWDDLWLNQAFATWLEGKIVTAWKPEWDGAVDMVGTKSVAMGADTLKTERKIRQSIETEDDIKNAFDATTYQKGAAIIRSFESWIGEDRFRKGVRKYIADHAWGSATSTDFLAAIGDAAGTDVATPFSTFLDQVGAPLVSFELVYPKGAPPTLKLSQRRYVPLASKASSDQIWSIPVCVDYPAGDARARACTLMTSRTGELPLTAATTCPAWVMPNAGGLGYYRPQLLGGLLPELLKRGMKKLSVPERVGVIDDVGALVGGVCRLEFPFHYYFPLHHHRRTLSQRRACRGPAFYSGTRH